ncbi:MAG TPA: dihydrolipoyl dehydrogenase [Candidatus Acidoferrum sp.]|nr:dihydrolipoyl dehydrogenase [Candidatus Acidoferrum sp.]
MTKQFEAAILGSGPGGYVAAIRLGQLGKQTALIEKANLGGVCLNIGCIPSKALMQVARLKRRIEIAKQMGMEVSDLKIDFIKTQTWKQNIVNRLTSGVEYLCKSNNVDIIKGEGKFQSPHEIIVTTSTGTETIETKNTVIATGSRAMQIPGLEFDGTNVISSTEALELQQIPPNFVVVGGGVTGLEMATMYAELGSKVTVIEMLDQLLPGVDIELVRIIERSLRRLGIDYHVKSKAKEYREGQLRAILEDGTEAMFTASKVLVSVGRRPNSDNIGLDRAGVKTNPQGWLQTDKHMETNVPGIYSIGDVNGPPLFAHKASKEGIVAAESIAGMKSEADFRAIPWAIFTDPEIASAGLTESQAREKGYDPIIGKFPFTALGRALLAGETEGFVKVVADKNSELVLGIHIVGPEASDLISEAALAIEMGATLRDIELTIHPHPTLPESIMEAAAAAKGRAIHILQK